MRRHHATRHVVVSVTTHQVEIGRRQDGHRDPRLGERARDRVQALARNRRELGEVTDRHPTLPAELAGLPAHVLRLHAVRGVTEVEVHVDVDVELAGQLEHAVDLPAGVRVRVGRGADDARRAL